MSVLLGKVKIFLASAGLFLLANIDPRTLTLQASEREAILLEEKLYDYQQGRPEMSVDQAVEAWLGLIEQVLKLDPEDYQGKFAPPGFSTLLGVSHFQDTHWKALPAALDHWNQSADHRVMASLLKCFAHARLGHSNASKQACADAIEASTDLRSWRREGIERRIQDLAISLEAGENRALMVTVLEEVLDTLVVGRKQSSP